MNTKVWKEPVQKTVTFEFDVLNFYSNLAMKTGIGIDRLIDRDLKKINKLR